MRKLSDLDYLRLHGIRKFGYNLGQFFCSIPGWFAHKFKNLWKKIKAFFIWIYKDIIDTFNTVVHGSWKTKVSCIIMGFGSIAYGQVVRGILFFLFEAVFIAYMILTGGYWLSKFGTLGTVSGGNVIQEIIVGGEKYETQVWVDGDNSFKILLYGLLTIMFIIAFIYTWRLNIKQCGKCEKIIASGKKVKSGKDDMKSLLDDQFHKTLLALPIGGIVMFTVLPIIFMILVAFTNYDSYYNGYSNLFTWVGLDNFNALFEFGEGSSKLSVAFGEILSWTLIWAFFATFTNYFLGMFVAIMINKKGIKIKKFWRTVLVVTIAVPQFISLLYISNMLAPNGIVNGILMNLGWIDKAIPFWTDGTLAKVMIIIINIWIGIPYLMLIETGIIMNIPQDLYESARIDGANVWQQYTRITLPYMLFVTGPYLLTSFINNINNFNVIYLLTKGRPNMTFAVEGNTPGETDLLITWLFKMTAENAGTANYKLASVIGIMIFIVCAVLSLIVYNIMPSNKNEEDFS